MGTRAAFWLGDPSNVGHREWLGCMAYDGHPDNPDLMDVCNSDTEVKFRKHIKDLSGIRDDWTDPKIHGWPFPWDKDVFLTDYTYAFMSGRVMVTCFHGGFHNPHDYSNESGWDYGAPDKLPRDIPAPSKYDRSAPDSVMNLSDAISPTPAGPVATAMGPKDA